MCRDRVLNLHRHCWWDIMTLASVYVVPLLKKGLGIDQGSRKQVDIIDEIKGETEDS